MVESTARRRNIRWDVGQQMTQVGVKEEPVTAAPFAEIKHRLLSSEPHSPRNADAA